MRLRIFESMFESSMKFESNQTFDKANPKMIHQVKKVEQEENKNVDEGALCQSMDQMKLQLGEVVQALKIEKPPTNIDPPTSSDTPP